MEYLEQFCGLTAIEACHRGPEQCSCWLQWRFIRSEFGAPWAMQCLTGMTWAPVLTSCCPNDVHDRVGIKMRNVLIFFRKTLVDCWNKDFFAKHRKNVHKSYYEECCPRGVWDPQVAEEREAKVTWRAICHLYKQVSWIHKLFLMVGNRLWGCRPRKGSEKVSWSRALLPIT